MSFPNTDTNAQLPATHPVALPQHCSQEEREWRRKELAEACEHYEFEAWREGYPRVIKSVPWRERLSGALGKLVLSGLNLLGSKLVQQLRYSWYKLVRGGGNGPPFAAYTALYGQRDLPEIGRNQAWMGDAVFAAQRLNGMYPWFIRRVISLAALREYFPITNQMVANLLPENTTLEQLQQQGRLYVVSQPSLENARPAHGHVMTTPTTLFQVDGAGQLMPLAIQLHRSAAIFTPNADPETWLAVKIHAACADTLVHSVYSHAILMHFVMCNVWTAANRRLAPTHPVHSFLKPHFWGTLFATDAIKGTMDEEDGEQTQVYGTGLAGQDQMVSQLFQDFDFQEYDPEVDLRLRGVDDANELPDFYYRDDALEIWEADKTYVKEMMDLFYESDQDVKQDDELQAWMAEMASAQGANIQGLPLNANRGIDTRDDLYGVLTAVLFTVTSRHSSIENGALQYLYVPANPFSYRLAAPESSAAQMDLQQVADALPEIRAAIHGYALIASARFDPQDEGLLGRYQQGKPEGWPDAMDQIIQKWRDALVQIGRNIDGRNGKLKLDGKPPYTAMHPRKAFNSIWN